MKVYTIPAGPLATNCYLLAGESGRCAIIDPGGEPEKIERVMKEHNLTPEMILHEDDRIMLETAAFNVSAEITGHPVILSPDRVLADGDKLLVDNQPVLVIHTPGHTRGGLCLVEGTSLFSGDTLFRQSMGRTDLYGGDERALLASLAKLASLPGDYTVYPGHGPATTLNWERQHNPYMRTHL